jgi:pimeloyl-ACP methyl ester carboxylesterase
MRYVTILCSLCVFGLMVFGKKIPKQKPDDYPYRVERFSFTSQRQQLEMAYMYQRADQPNGRTVLLLHGKNFSGAYWGGVMKELLSKGYNVVVPDQVGFGKSSLPANYQFTFQQLAENTKQLLDSLKIRNVIVLGHSMGGMLGVRFALMYPKATTQLILENPIGLEDWKLVAPYTTVDEEFAKEKKKTKQAVKEYYLKNYFHNEWKSEYNALLDQGTMRLGTPEHDAQAWCMALTTDMIFTQPVCYEFSRLNVPVVLIIGQLDRTAIGKDRVDRKTAATMGNYPELGKSTVAQIPGGLLMEIPTSGHIPHIEEPELFLEKLISVVK